MDEILRPAGAALDELVNHIEGGSAFWTVTQGKRRRAGILLAEILGVVLDETGYPPRGLIGGGPINKRDDGTIARIATSMDAWLRCTDGIDEDLLPTAASSGTAAIVTAMGFSSRRTMTLTAIRGGAVLRNGARKVVLSLRSGTVRTTYENGRSVAWTDGVIEAPGITPPIVMAQALCGMQASAVTDDPMLAHATIRHVCMAPSRDGRIRIVTQDALRTETKDMWR